MKRTKQKSMREQRIEVISEIYTCELLEQNIDAKLIAQNNQKLTLQQITKLHEIQERYHFIIDVYKKLINLEWEWDRISPLVKAILISGANEFWSLDPKIVISEAVIITKLFFSMPEKNGKELLENRIYKFVNGLLENFYKFLIKLESVSK